MHVHVYYTTFSPFLSFNSVASTFNTQLQPIYNYFIPNFSKANNFENVLKEQHLVNQIKNNSGHYI